MTTVIPALVTVFDQSSHADRDCRGFLAETTDKTVAGGLFPALAADCMQTRRRRRVSVNPVPAQR